MENMIKCAIVLGSVDIMNISIIPGSSGLSLVAQMVKRLSTTRETWVRSLGREDSLEKEMATHPSTLA